MTEKPNTPRGRPVTNKVDQIPASAEQIARAIFKSADTKTAKRAKPKRKKPN